MENFYRGLNISMLTESELKRLSPLKYAYIGDAIYEVYIRSYVLATSKKKINDINKLVVEYVRASAQGYAVKNMETFLSEEEWDIVKWGRNQKTISSPKNANMSDYKYATGFETLLGLLFLKQNENRLEEIITQAIKLIESMEN